MKKLVLAILLLLPVAQASASSKAVNGAVVIGAMVGQASACGHSVKRAHLVKLIQKVSDLATSLADWADAKATVRKTILAAYQMQRATPKMTCEQVMAVIRESERRVR